MSKKTLLLGLFFLAASLGVYTQVTFRHGPAVEIAILGEHVFRVPERNFVTRANWSVACCIPGLRQGGPGEIFEYQLKKWLKLLMAIRLPTENSRRILFG